MVPRILRLDEPPKPADAADALALAHLPRLARGVAGAAVGRCPPAQGSDAHARPAGVARRGAFTRHKSGAARRLGT